MTHWPSSEGNGTQACCSRPHGCNRETGPRLQCQGDSEDLGSPSCSLLLGRKTYLLARGGLWDLEFQCLDFLSLPSRQLNLVVVVVV